MLMNGMGGIDWSGLAVAVELLAIDDVEQFVADLVTIRSHLGRDEASGVEDA